MQVIGDIASLSAKRYPDKVALIMDDEIERTTDLRGEPLPGKEEAMEDDEDV